MKKRLFIIGVAACCCFVLIAKGSWSEAEADLPAVEVLEYEPSENDPADHRDAPQHGQTIEISKDQIYQGDLLLVNSDYPVREESIKSDIVKLASHRELVQGYGLLDNDIYLSVDIAEKFSAMMAFAAEAGVHNFWMTSGYRSFDEQQKLYEELGPDTALPAGYSEHNIGLSLDVGTTQMTMAKAREGKWIEDHAWKYGFILRYPKNKSHITGIQYEPWHIRYVGLPHSAVMKEKNFVLEEYLQYLKEKQELKAKVDGKEYIIFYYPVDEPITIAIPENYEFAISGNNVDGVIVTMIRMTA